VPIDLVTWLDLASVPMGRELGPEIPTTLRTTNAESMRCGWAEGALFLLVLLCGFDA
jgi:hypothetical protein